MIEGLKERIRALERFDNNVGESFRQLGGTLMMLDRRTNDGDSDNNNCCVNLFAGKIYCGTEVPNGYGGEPYMVGQVDNGWDLRCSKDEWLNKEKGIRRTENLE